MKISWVQVLVSLLIGLLLGLNFNSLGLRHCKGCFDKHGYNKSSCHNKKDCHGCHKMERLNQKLNLTPEQQSKLAAIMDEKHKQMIEFRKSTQSKIKSILTPEQQTKFDELHAKWDAKREKWHEKSNNE